LSSKIRPNCKKVVLLDAGDGWRRDRFTEMGVIHYRNWVDTRAEYGWIDDVAQDRASASPVPAAQRGSNPGRHRADPNPLAGRVIATVRKPAGYAKVRS
jgi:hypothetical protein